MTTTQDFRAIELTALINHHATAANAWLVRAQGYAAAGMSSRDHYDEAEQAIHQHAEELVVLSAEARDLATTATEPSSTAYLKLQADYDELAAQLKRFTDHWVLPPSQIYEAAIKTRALVQLLTTRNLMRHTEEATAAVDLARQIDEFFNQILNEESDHG